MSVGGTVLGIVAGLLIGGIGIAAMGDDVGVPASVILALIGAIIGNRAGVELDRRGASRRLPGRQGVQQDPEMWLSTPMTLTMQY